MRGNFLLPLATTIPIVLLMYLVSNLLTYSGVFRGARCDAPLLARPWEFFTGDFIWKGAFLPFSSKNCKIQQCLMFFLRFHILEKWANLRFPLNIQKQKVFQLQGGFAPWPPGQGLCPWTPLGLRPQIPVMGSRSARSPWPPFAKS